MKPVSWRLGLVVSLLMMIVLLPYACFGREVAAWVRDLLEPGSQGRWMVALMLMGVLASDIILPVPSTLVCAAGGLLLGPLHGALAAFVGLCLSSLIGYAIGTVLGPFTVGRYFSPVELARVERWHSTLGVWMIAVARPIPVLAEVSTVFAGMMRFGIVSFLIVITVMNGLIAGVCAWLGSLGRLLG